MEFASEFFIELFLPAVLIVYWLLGLIRSEKGKTVARNIFLLIASCVFYAVGGIRMLGLFVSIIALNFFAGIVIEYFGKQGKAKLKKLVFVVSVLLNVFVLAFFKYFNMVVKIIEIFMDGGDVWQNLMLFKGTGALNITAVAMPLGISFIIFQAISYIADVYKEKTPATKNALTFALYNTLFCQLLQGPIMRFDNLGSQIESRKTTVYDTWKGFERFVIGLGKKVLVANVLALQVDRIFSSGSTNVDVTQLGAPIAWIGILFYTLQIYYDFSGYTDMAIGIGRMLGFKIDRNFEYPYTALSTQDFWRRWHITLSSWFKDYIYIPLGGSRCSKARACFNVAVVFFVTGIWHGANLTFIAWGLVFVITSVLERLFLGDLLKKNPVKIINWLYTIFVVMMGWVLFRSDNLDFAFKYFAQLFSFKSSPAGYSVLSYLGIEVFVATIIGILFSGLIQRPLKPAFDKLGENMGIRTFDNVVRYVLILAIFAFCLFKIVGGSYSSSIYMQF